MATLLSEDIECVSSLAVVCSESELSAEEHPGQQWQQIDLTVLSGDRRMTEVCLLCRYPADEVADLVSLLQELIDASRNEIIFEPSEPSFELTLVRTREGGVKAEVWIDSGNASTGFYRWDAAGIRFYTTIENLAEFKQALEQEFPIQAQPA